MLRRSTRVVSVKPDSDSRTRSKSKNSTLYRVYKSVFGPSKAKLESMARFRGIIEQCDEVLNKFIDRNESDTGGRIVFLLDKRNTYYDKLRNMRGLTAEDIAADKAIHARIKQYHSRQGITKYHSQYAQNNLAGTRKRRKHKKYKQH